MWLNSFKNQSIQSIMAQATALKQKGFYAAAKHLVKQQLAHHPSDETLHAFYKRIEMLQLIKINRRH